jgi:hypothetical protein
MRGKSEVRRSKAEGEWCAGNGVGRFPGSRPTQFGFRRSHEGVNGVLMAFLKLVVSTLQGGYSPTGLMPTLTGGGRAS